MRLSDRILSSEHFADQPPVIIDIGGAGGMQPLWRPIARYAHCIAFDADQRDFGESDSRNSGWKNLTIFQRVVTESPRRSITFHLTESAHCSSSLRPNVKGLEPWDFRGLFDVTGSAELPAINLSTALDELNLHYVDWFKTDSQGTDLRLWNSLSQELRRTVAVASFEPGILDAYVGEDKWHAVMAQMDTRDWYLARLDVRGARRVDNRALPLGPRMLRRLAMAGLAPSPGWVEAWYVRNYSRDEDPGVRSLLMAWIGATRLRQHGHAWNMARLGTELHGLKIFEECERASERSLLVPNLETFKRLAESGRHHGSKARANFAKILD
jgi:hypothetical protein